MRLAVWFVCLASVACGKSSVENKPEPVKDRCGGCKTTGACVLTSTTTTTVNEFGSKGHDVERSTDYSCVPGTDAHCQQSTDCPITGKCSRLVDQFGKVECAATKDADCRGSDQCKIHGRCFTYGESGVCRGGTDADCAASHECKQRGHCVYIPETPQKRGLCGPKTAADCKRAPLCAEKGSCTFQKNGIGIPQCVTATDAECAASTMCKTEGACRLYVGQAYCTK